MAERRRLDHPPGVEETSEHWMEPGPHVWRILVGTEEHYAMALGLWIDGQPTMAGLPVRAAMAWNSLLGGTTAPILVSVTPVVDWAHKDGAGQQAIEAKLSAFLLAHAGWEAQLRVMAEASHM